MKVSKEIAESMVRLPKVSAPKTPDMHIIAMGGVGEREYKLHATKGYRSNKV